MIAHSQRPGQLIEFGLTAGEGGDIARQGPGRRCGEGSQPDAASGRGHVLSSDPPRAAATNSPLTGPSRPSASASRTAVSLWAVRLMPRSRSLTVRGLTPAASASSSWVSRASARSCAATRRKKAIGPDDVPDATGAPLSRRDAHSEIPFAGGRWEGSDQWGNPVEQSSLGPPTNANNGAQVDPNDVTWNK